MTKNKQIISPKKVIIIIVTISIKWANRGVFDILFLSVRHAQLLPFKSSDLPSLQSYLDWENSPLGEGP